MKELGKTILQRLRKMHRLDLSKFIAPRLIEKPLFEFIVGVMLSQNTSDRNAIKAYNNLIKIYGSPLTPDKILSKPYNVLEDAIKIAGMYKQRARRIYELAKLFSKPGFEEELKEKIKVLDVNEARQVLMELPGVGIKSADVILSQYFGKPSFPIDTHIRRITARLGYVNARDYVSISDWWRSILEPRDYLEAHLLLITHGRRICRARNPLCEKCLLTRDICKYGMKRLGEQ